MKRFVRMAGIALLFAGALFAAPKKKKKEAAAASADAARVAILLYDDKTGTQNFGYMPQSLKEAITNSMHEKFEFNEVDTTRVDPIVSKIRSKNKGTVGAKEAAEICRQADIDILIYGDFTFNQDAQKIEIHTNISLGSTDKFRTLPAITNPVDSTIFQAADKVATDIVAEITKIAKEQQQAKGKAAEADKKKKTQLEKTEKAKTWADINWTFAFSPGVVEPLIKRDVSHVRTSPAASVYGMYRLKGNWHVGLFASYAEIRSESTNTPFQTEINYLGTTANVGYYFDPSARWRWTNMLGVGYYIGNFKVNLNCRPGDPFCSNLQSSFQPINQSVRNPFFMARTGIHFLVFSFLSLGVEAEYRMLYDSKPIHAAGGAISLSVVF